MRVEQPRIGPGVVVGGLLIVAAGVGWFVLSRLVMGETTGDAIGEGLGVMLALLVVASVVGAIRSGRGSPG